MKLSELLDELNAGVGIGIDTSNWNVMIEDEAHVPDDFKTSKSIVAIKKIRWIPEENQVIIEADIQ